jgi:DNA-binding NtrC family response regulator
VLEALRSYSWAGNVRQLRNCLERAVLLADHGKITIKELAPEVVYRREGANVAVNYTAQNSGPVSSFQNTAPVSLRDVERQQILSALEKTGWHRGKTAELLGISPSTLYRRLREYDLESRLSR